MGVPPPQNFIVFGEMGVGKSSLINLIAGRECAESSSDAKSCTLQSTKYEIEVPDHQLHVNLYDTVGLNEPNMSGSSYLDALVKAHELIVSLEKQGGIHGLLFCVRGSRISSTVQQNYRLFHEFLCQGKVPLALVITGLENEKGDMDCWWTRNQAQVEKCGIASFTQVCVTTIMGYNDAYEKRYMESRTKMLNVLSLLGSKAAYSVDVSSWFVRMCRKMRELLAPVMFAWSGRDSRPSRDKMMRVLTGRCKLPKDDATELLRRIDTEKV
ncbi:hypothetical protein AZE42_06625 [Rhizopogon vesiculosus]|uniref:G domain-containing protein n=1 Tax=Rhizopogon vesiculosus TaxID=180088 RepID=A0A1J8PWK4_9AGAM|nr:hypothetical protein AZE42_06625 [Rhizopogon vesiculosus]